jgi:hypothetical protein
VDWLLALEERCFGFDVTSLEPNRKKLLTDQNLQRGNNDKWLVLFCEQDPLERTLSATLTELKTSLKIQVLKMQTDVAGSGIGQVYQVSLH